jgi:curli biogenesis system outer membrane secretion channel CsgG
MVKLGKFKVIERQMLDNLLNELNLQGTGAVDPETTKKIGKVLGVEAIVTGTVLDVEDGMAEINARMIKTDTAEVLGSSSAEIRNTWAAAPAPAPREDEDSYSKKRWNARRK